MNSSQVESFCRELCDRITDGGKHLRWEQRVATAMLVITRMTGVAPELMCVQAALYSRSAVFRLGGALMPAHQGEVDHFREQVGPAMILMGIERPHAILLVGDVMIELADASQWNDRGVLLRPFVDKKPRSRLWIVTGLRYGVTITYAEQPGEPLRITPDLAAYKLARTIEAAMRAFPLQAADG